MMKSLIIGGSPRRRGRTNSLISALVGYRQSYEPSVHTEVFTLADNVLDPCKACDCCKDTFCCIIKDDMQKLYPLLDAADEIIIVSPVYFAGPPAQMKALLDRLQPYYWKYLKQERRTKRPAALYVVGSGGDPHGFDPLVVSVRSALAVARFQLEQVYDCVQLGDEAMGDVVKNPEAYRYTPGL